MKKILGIFLAFLFIGCSAPDKEQVISEEISEEIAAVTEVPIKMVSFDLRDEKTIFYDRVDEFTEQLASIDVSDNDALMDEVQRLIGYLAREKYGANDLAKLYASVIRYGHLLLEELYPRNLVSQEVFSDAFAIFTDMKDVVQERLKKAGFN
jgi:hypothetical protein